MRAPTAIALILAACLSAGCYGSTEYVTQLLNTSATLNGRGTTNDGPADVYFEYWPTATPAARSTTPAKRIPGGVTGPLSAPVAGLGQDTSYSYRLCGGDEGEPAVCANTRTFVTGRSSVNASGNEFVPYGETGWRDIDLNAYAAPAGSTPDGRAFAVIYNQETGPPGGISLPLGSRGATNITCVAVEANTAVVGFVQRPPFGDLPPQDQQYAFLYDGGIGGDGDRFSTALYFKPTVPPADCPPFPDPGTLQPLSSGQVEIIDLRRTPTG
ncbi:MAG: hypothetical protein JW895_04465 [Thermoleophilaceae bacterium]|nr:hypothetical protein [Thermoleophilaceae bacterium]